MTVHVPSASAGEGLVRVDAIGAGQEPPQQREPLVPIQAAAADAKQRLALVLQATRLGLWDWNMQTGETVFDERWAEIVGYRLDELSPTSIDTWTGLCHPDDLARSDELIDRHSQGLTPYFDIEARMRHRDGRWVWVHDRGKIVEWTPDGRPLRMTGTHEDITDRVVAREALADSERRFRLLAENATDVVFLADPAGVFTWVSPATRQVLGYDPQALVGTQTADLVHPDDLPVVHARRAQVEKGQTEVHFELRVRTAAGQYRWMSGATGPAFAADGTVLGRITSLRDFHEQVLARKALEVSERRYRLLAENASDVVFLVDQQMIIQWTSPSVTPALGWQTEQILGHPAVEFIHPDDRSALRKAVSGTAAGQQAHAEVRARCADGSYRWISGIGRLVTDTDGVVVGRVVGLRDIDDLVRAREAAESSQARYRLLAENASDVVWQVAPDGALVWSSESVTTLLGWQIDRILGRDAMDLIHPDDQGRAMAGREDVLAGSTVHGEFRVLRADGSFRWMHLTIHPVQLDDGVARVLGLRDIHDEVAARTELEHATKHDSLTGLATRPVALARIDRLLGGLGRSRTVGVLCVGVDSLTAVNEAFTHTAGDRVLMTIAARIATAAQDPDLMARGSGDELIVVLPDLTTGADAGIIAEQVRHAAKGTVAIGRNRLEPTVSIGIATGARHDRACDLLRDASLAMRQAKANGPDSCAFFEDRLASEAQRLLAIEADIRDGLRQDRFVTWWQPIVELDGGTLVGYEALARCVRADGSIAEPQDFLPVAERTTLIADIDRIALQQAVEFLNRLPQPIHVAVNVSAATLTSPDHLDAMTELLTRSSVDSTRLRLEVTETARLSVTHRIRDVMCQLVETGIRWYADDFGTGYSSIAHLRDLPIAGLKLDRSFTAGLGTGDRTCERLAEAIAGLADGLALDTVAEGIETPHQAAILTAQGWKHGQGWLYGHATPFTTAALDRS